ncbi:hypothetical protein PFISCL1PPCAC_18450, partial [Pristionchus fissidentatus]
LKKNPLGKVPTFEKDGEIVYDSAVVLEYLDGIYPDSAILPTDPYLRAQSRMLIERTAPLASSFFGLFIIHSEKIEGAEREAKIKAVEEAIDSIEKLITEPFFGGNSAGFVDYLILPFFERVAHISPLLSIPSPFPSSDRWPGLSSWFGRCCALPAAVAAMQPAAYHQGFIKTFVIGKSADCDFGI